LSLLKVIDLSVRSCNCLKRANINTVEYLIGKTEDDIMKIEIKNYIII